MKKPMHIAFFTNLYHPWVSGVVRSISSFRRDLSDRGHNVFIFAQEASGYKDDEPFIFRYPSLSFTWPTDFYAVIPISSFVDHLIPSLKLDIIHAHHPILLGRAAANKAAELDVPLVFTFHSQYNEYTQYLPLNQETIQDFIKELIGSYMVDYMKRCQHIIVPSDSMLDLLESEYGLKDDVSVVPTGIDVTRFQDSNGLPIRKKMGWKDDIVMLSVGRLTPEKNWTLLLNACAKVFESRPKFRVAIIGDGFERDKLEKYVSNLGIAHRVDFLGEIDYEEIPAYYKAADFFGFASTAETQGLVTMEALAAGLPVVAIDAIGTKDNVENNRQGFLTSSDVNEIAEAIGKMVDLPALREQFSASALARASAFDVSVQTEKLLISYQKAIKAHQVGHSVVLARTKKIFSLGT
jgi:1,2-diacylglycerol 3-alpha-glucosyltransferase